MITCSRVEATWSGSFSGIGTIRGKDFSSAVSLPAAFNGQEVGATPEDLLAAALGSCYLITLGIILEKQSIPYRSLSIATELQTETKFPPQIQEVVLRPRIVMDVMDDRLEAALGKALEMCLVSQAVKGLKKTLEPQIELT